MTSQKTKLLTTTLIAAMSIFGLCPASNFAAASARSTPARDGAGQDVAAKPHFSVRDGIEMQLPIALRGVRQEPEPTLTRTSPNGEYVAMVTKKGDLNLGKNAYTLWIYRTADIVRFLNQPKSSPMPAALPAMKVETLDRSVPSAGLPSSAIRNVKWYGDNHIAFVATGDNEPGNVYVYDLKNKSVRRLTNAAGTVVDYDISFQAGAVVFLARSLSTPQCEMPFPEPMKITTQSWMTAVGACNPGKPSEVANIYPRIRAYLARIGDPDNATPVSGEFWDVFTETNLQISPDGKWATMVATVDHPLPLRWQEHFRPDPGDYDFWGRNGGPTSDNPMPASGPSPFAQFHLIDLTKGLAKPMFDAPAAYHGVYAKSHWLPDSQSVLLTHTYLPAHTSPRGGAPEARKLNIVEYTIRTGDIRPIFTFEDGFARSKSKEIYGRTKLINGEQLAVFVNSKSDRRFLGHLGTETADVLLLTRTKGGWKRGKAAPLKHIAQPNRLEFFVEQDLNTPPNYAARDLRTGRKAVFTNLNPQLDGITVPKAQVFEWRTPSGAPWKGGLVLPPGHRPGQRVPLVIQVHCFEEEYFLIESSEPLESSPFAGRALAGAGIAVLQVNANSEDVLMTLTKGEPGQGTAFSEGMESAVAQLHELGLIDRERVGIIGWSAGGRAVLSALTKSKVNFGAAIISDAASVGPVTYSLGAAAPGDTAIPIEDYTEGYPWGDGLENWIRNQPFYHMDRVNAALRIEVNNRLASIYFYDLLTVRNRLSKPTELYIYEGASHAPLNPMQRHISSQGTIDWMSFWLMGRESNDPAKAEQYKAWRDMKNKASRTATAGISTAATRDRSALEN